MLVTIFCNKNCRNRGGAPSSQVVGSPCTESASSSFSSARGDQPGEAFTWLQSSAAPLLHCLPFHLLPTSLVSLQPLFLSAYSSKAPGPRLILVPGSFLMGHQMHHPPVSTPSPYSPSPQTQAPTGP